MVSFFPSSLSDIYQEVNTNGGWLDWRSHAELYQEFQHREEIAAAKLEDFVVLPAAADFRQALRDPQVRVWGIIRGGELLATVKFERRGLFCWEAHANIRKEWRGAEGFQWGADAMSALRADSPTSLVLFVIIPASNLAARKYARHQGFAFTGSVPECFVKNGKLWGLHTYYKVLH